MEARHGFFARGRRRLASRLVAGLAACAAIVAATEVVGQPPGRRSPAIRRSRPPAGAWDDVTAGTFQSDAFSALQGPRPSFARKTGVPAPEPTPPGPDGPSGDGFKWSALISADTLTDEIKGTKASLAAACVKPTEFKGGGYEKARVGFSSLALAFGVIAAYDGDVRWKKDAARARDLFARVGFNCKAGTEQSFAESKLRLADLESLLDGNPPAGQPDANGDVKWSEVAGRPALMSRLEAAEEVLQAALASQAAFRGGLDDLRHASEIVAAIGEVIRRPSYDHHDDDDYGGHAAAMRDAAVAIRAACEKKDYDAARAAAGRLKKACDDCHGGYRS